MQGKASPRVKHQVQDDIEKRKEQTPQNDAMDGPKPPLTLKHNHATQPTQKTKTLRRNSREAESVMEVVRVGAQGPVQKGARGSGRQVALVAYVDE